MLGDLIKTRDFDYRLGYAIANDTCLICNGSRVGDYGVCVECIARQQKSILDKIKSTYKVKKEIWVTRI